MGHLEGSDTLEARQERLQAHLQQLAIQKEMAASEQKERLARRLGQSIGMALVARCLKAWSDQHRRDKRQRAIDHMNQLQAELQGGVLERSHYC